ncbi:MAG: hypothetical protein N3D10_00715 [Candidatus Micrarchaeota archaeon]|nr:hypothetical protein [Candidatus Micrarchaeota archaeon]
MESKNLILIFGVILLVSLALFFFQNKSFSLPNSDNKLILYWGVGCPHCQKVKDYINQTSLDSKVMIVEKEVYSNSSNAQELVLVAKSCGLKEQEIGIPLIFFNNKCYIGEVEAIDLLKTFN